MPSFKQVSAISVRAFLRRFRLFHRPKLKQSRQSVKACERWYKNFCSKNFSWWLAFLGGTFNGIEALESILSGSNSWPLVWVFVERAQAGRLRHQSFGDGHSTPVKRSHR